GEARDTELNALVRDYANLAYHGLRSQRASFDIDIRMELDDTVGSVRVVPQEIGRVVLNLVHNACHAAHNRKLLQGRGDFSPQLVLRTRSLGSRVQISIRDNGMGIPAAIRDKIFNPFFTTKQPGEGTGLGLSISYEIIVHGNGGTLEF